MNPLPLANDPDAETTSASLSHPPIASESNGVKLETPRDFIQIWEQSPTSPNCLYLKVSNQTCSEQEATWPQV